MYWRSLACAAFLASVAGCTTAPLAEPIKVGAVLPFSGGVELYGAQARLGLELAAADINASGGVLGRPIEMVFRDDGTRPHIAAEAARKAVEEDGVVAVVGPITSQNLDAIVPVLASRRTPLLYAANYEGGKCSRYMFALNTVPNQELAPLLPYMTQTFGSDYFLMGADRPWPHRMFDAAQPLIAGLGGKVAGTQYTLGAEKDFAPLADQVAASRAKVLLYALKGDGMLFIPYAADRGLFKTVTVAFLGLTEADLQVFGGRIDGIHAVVPYVVAGDDPQARAFVARARARAAPGMAISNYVVMHYNALVALKGAIERAGRVDREAIVDALEGLAFESLSGPMTIGKDHHTTMNMFLARTRGPDLVQVRALGPIAPLSGCKPEQFLR